MSGMGSGTSAVLAEMKAKRATAKPSVSYRIVIHECIPSMINFGTWYVPELSLFLESKDAKLLKHKMLPALIARIEVKNKSFGG